MTVHGSEESGEEVAGIDWWAAERYAELAAAALARLVSVTVTVAVVRSAAAFVVARSATLAADGGVNSGLISV